MAEVGRASDDREIQEEREQLLTAERLVVFTDAVVAIALTLLVLPLLEAVPEHGSSKSASDWLGDHRSQMIGLAVSFAVAATFWNQHNKLWSYVERQTGLLVVLNFLWMLDIVFLQIPTALVYALDTSRVLIGLYIGTMAFGSAMLTAMAWQVYRTDSAQDPDRPMPLGFVSTSVAATLVYLVSLVVGVALPSVNYFALFLLVLIGPVRAIVVRAERRRRRDEVAAT